MTQDKFAQIYETSETGKEMIIRLLDTIPLSEKDREYTRHMIEHIIHNERIDAAVHSDSIYLNK